MKPFPEIISYIERGLRMADVQSVFPDTAPEKINGILERDGCVVIRGAMSEQDLDNIQQELEAHMKGIPNCKGDFYGYVTKRMSGLIEKAPTSRKLAVMPQILNVMDYFLLPNCSEYQLNLTQAIRIGPGEPQQLIHSDDLMFRYDHPGSEAMVNCMWAIDDFTGTNGATLLVPGSHKWEKDRVPEDHEITNGIMPAGSVLIYLGSLLHAGGCNTSGQSRTGMVISYNLGWLRQAENQYLATPMETAKSLPERLQRLLGYFVHEPNLGCVDGQNPILLLSDSSGKNNYRFQEYIPEEFHPVLKDHREEQIRKIA